MEMNSIDFERVETCFLQSFGEGETSRTGTGEKALERRIKTREVERSLRCTGRDGARFVRPKGWHSLIADACAAPKAEAQQLKSPPNAEHKVF